MNLPDLVNAAFEAFGSVAIALSCRRVLKDKQVKGISILTVTFFTTWGLWNLWYYPSLGQNFSGFAAACTCLANFVWILLIVRYRK